MRTTPPVPSHSNLASAFGFQVHCQHRLRFARSGGGVERLEIVTAREPRRRPDGPPIAWWAMAGVETGQEVDRALYRLDHGFEFWVKDIGVYYIDAARGRIEIPEGGNEIVREQRLWGIPTTLCFMERGDLALHAAAVDVDGSAVLLAAPGRHGKTTLALAFHLQGYRVLSEDLACCRVRPSLELLPGPAILRVRSDVYAGHPPSGTHVVLTRSDRVYLGLDDDRKGSSAPVPIAAVVFLRESLHDTTIERVAPPVALADLWALSFRLRTSESQARSFQQLSRLAGEVPMWNLYRPLHMDNLEPTVARIVAQIDQD